MIQQNLSEELRVLTNYFIGYISSFIAMILSAAFEVEIVFFLSLLIGVLSGLLFLIKLDTLALILKRSRIVWVGGSFIFAPLGLLIAYFNMRRIVNNQLNSNQLLA